MIRILREAFKNKPEKLKRSKECHLLTILPSSKTLCGLDLDIVTAEGNWGYENLDNFQIVNSRITRVTDGRREVPEEEIIRKSLWICPECNERLQESIFEGTHTNSTGEIAIFNGKSHITKHGKRFTSHCRLDLPSGLERESLSYDLILQRSDLCRDCFSDWFMVWKSRDQDYLDCLTIIEKMQELSVI